MSEHEKTVRAKQQVEAETGFYVHSAIFVVVMTSLVLLNASSGSNWWVQWPLIGWGLGVGLHASLVFGRTPQFITDWQLRKIKKLRDSM